MPQYTYPIGPDGPLVPIMVGLDAHSSGLIAQAGMATPNSSARFRHY